MQKKHVGVAKQFLGNEILLNFLQVVLMSTGDIYFVPPVIHRTFCNFNTENWPWGEQNCSLIFGSWTYSEKDLNLVANDDSSMGGAIDTKYFSNPRVRIS